MPRGGKVGKGAPVAVLSSDSDDDGSGSEENSASQGSSAPESDDSFYGDFDDGGDATQGGARYGPVHKFGWLTCVPPCAVLSGFLRPLLRLSVFLALFDVESAVAWGWSL